jgi:hypothetical protein
MTKQDSTYGAIYNLETDPVMIDKLEQAAKQKHDIKKVMVDRMEGQNLQIPRSTKFLSTKPSASLHHEAQYSPLSTLPQPDTSSGQSTEEFIKNMDQQILLMQQKRDKEIRRISPGLVGTLANGTTAPDSAEAQATAMAPIFTQLRRTIGTAKGVLTRTLTELDKKKDVRSYLDQVHKKLDEGLIRLQQNNDALLAVPGLTAADKQGIMDDFYDFEIKVTNAKNFATAQMSKLDRTIPSESQGNLRGVKTKYALTKETPEQERNQNGGKRGSKGSNNSKEEAPSARKISFAGNISADEIVVMILDVNK